MSVLKIFRRVQKFEKLHCLKFINKRFFSVEKVPLFKDSVISRKYLKPLTNLELKPLSDDFTENIFSGNLNKKIFEYPAVLRESDIHIVINHAAEVEKFLLQKPDAELSEDVINELRKLEVFGLTIPQKYGGAGYNESECIFLQECIGGHRTIGRFLGYNENFGCKILSQFATEEQKEKYLPGLAAGNNFISLAYLENGPLIDLSSFEGHAINDEEKKQYIISAEKKWVHNADKADFFLVLVKLADFLDKTAEVSVKFSLFIVEKNTPGLQIHKLLSKHAQENNLFDVSFKNVIIPYQNLMGSAKTDGYLALKQALSYSQLTDAVLCCNEIKQIIYGTSHFINEKSVNDQSVRGKNFLHENLASLSIYVYALESAIYLLSGRFDSHITPNLFNETIFVKALAIDFLHVAIKRFTEVLGRDSLKSSGLLHQAIKTVQYYSVFDENIEYLKMLSAAEGLIKSTKVLSKRIKMLRNPFDNSAKALKSVFSLSDRSTEVKKNHKYRLEVHQSLSLPADILEENITKLQVNVENMFTTYGSLALENEHLIAEFGNLAAYIYGLVACISRASSAICYDFPNYERDIILAQAFAHIANAKLNEIFQSKLNHDMLNSFYEKIGKITFSQKQYPAEHPLSRTY